MKSVFKKFFIVALIIIAALALFSCSDETDIPEGMQVASLEGEPFMLFVPKNWTLNSGNGASGAYLSSDAGISVTAFTLDGKDKELATLVTENI